MKKITPSYSYKTIWNTKNINAKIMAINLVYFLIMYKPLISIYNKMVKEINNPKVKFQEINFYPMDIVDLEPPEIIIRKDIDSNFRISQIMKYNEFLSLEISKRESAIKSFKNLDWVCFCIEIILTITDIVLGSAGLIFQNYLSSTSGICVLITTLNTFLRGCTKKFMRKIEKHQALLLLAKSKLSQVKDKYALAIRDGNIDHTEYTNIIDEFQKFENLRNEIINKLTN